MQKLTAVVITRNEARNIARCIESLEGIADEIVVVDSFSTDATPSICKGLGVQFHQREWKGYSLQKNYGNGLASNDLILSIDADEALSEELRNSILNAKNKEGGFAYSFNRLTNYCGKWIRHSGWYPDTKVRIFNRTAADWQGTVHEKLTVDPKTVKKLKGDLLHYSYYDVSEHVAQTDRFATLSAQELLESGVRPSLLRIVFSPVAKFIKFYLLRLGFLDGSAGWRIATISARGTYLKYARHYRSMKQRG